MSRPKVTVVGAGNVGATCAQHLFQRDFVDVALVDVVPGLARGKALDLAQSGSVVGSDAKITGSTAYDVSASSDVVVITAGIARKPGMSRDDLLLTNMRIVGGITTEVVKHSPDCVIVVISNPVDAMTQLVHHISKFPRNRVLGMSGLLDTARFRTFVAQETGVSVQDVSAFVLGGHGDAMVPLTRLCMVGGVPLERVLPPDKVKAIVVQTVNGGAEIVELLKTGSAFYAPGAAAAEMVEAILLDTKRVIPCPVYLEGEYGLSEVVMSVPVKLGSRGVEQIIELELTKEEKAALQKSADGVRNLVSVMKLGMES